jgi:hypothetical protein
MTVPVALWLLGERLEPGHAGLWGPAALVAAVGVVLLARSAGTRKGEPRSAIGTA